MSAREHSFLPTTLFIAGALLVWLGAFAVAYVFGAIACAKQFADLRIVGIPLVPAVAIIICVVAGILTIVLIRKGLAVQRLHPRESHDEFLGFVAVATSVLAIIALVMLALPSLLVRTCAQV